MAGILGFLWFELAFAGGQSGGVAPRDVALATLVYTALTLFAMSAFGTERWLERGEAFSVYFGMFSRLAALEAREGRLGVRRPLSAAGRWVAEVPGSVALVLVAIGGTSFDGAQEGALTEPIKTVFDWLIQRGLGFAGALRLTDTVFLALALLAVTALFALGIRGMRTVAGSPSLARLRRAFGHTLIPIALAYLVAHYFSLFLFQEQAQFGFLLSDPLGNGSDYFGTAGAGIDYGLIGATEVWYVQVAALVVGHVIGLTLAHDRALAVYRDPRSATRSQYWMLAVMISFTCLGLFLLSQANR